MLKLNWITQLKLKMIPTLDKWSDLGFVEIASPDDFFNVGYKGPHEQLPEVKGIICPIPQDLLPDTGDLTSYYNAVQAHPYFIKNIRDVRVSDDTTSRLSVFRGGSRSLEGELPEGLRAIERMLCEATETTLSIPSANVEYHVNSNYHRRPLIHSPTGIACLDGATTIMFRANANGKLTGQKSIPPNSMAIFLGWHAAPDTNYPRLNILCN